MLGAYAAVLCGLGVGVGGMGIGGDRDGDWGGNGHLRATKDCVTFEPSHHHRGRETRGDGLGPGFIAVLTARPRTPAARGGGRRTAQEIAIFPGALGAQDLVEPEEGTENSARGDAAGGFTEVRGRHMAYLAYIWNGSGFVP